MLIKLIAKVKSATVKNKTRQARFAGIGCPPQHVVTRWGSWSNAALYYKKKLSEVKAILKSCEESCILVTQAKIFLAKNGLTTTQNQNSI